MATHRTHRRGATLVLLTIMLAVIMGLLAFAVDIGYTQAAKTQLQRTADSAAMAACWELMEVEQLDGAPSDQDSRTRGEANSYMALNKVLQQTPGLSTTDVKIGYLSDPSDPSCVMVYNDPDKFNAVQVRVRRTSSQNGSVGLFFGRVLGTNSVEMESTATAAFIKQIKGFRAPESDETLGILPIALDQDTWNAMLAGAASDNWHYNPTTKAITAGSDGVLEMNLYPQGIGWPGNRGTVDIGGTDNSTAVLSRQISEGLNAEDLEPHGGKLEFDSEGKLYLNGDTGISAGIKDDLASIIGKPRMIPIFESASGNGNNCWYTIVDWVGVRILEVKLTGPMSQKRVIIQPAKYLAAEAINNEDAEKAHYIYSPVWIVR
jgi:Flp pilus assembly protein TadG